MDAKLAEVTRGSLVEAVHEGSVAVVTSDGALIAQAGDPSTHRYFRSSAKPFQAVPVVISGAADAYELTSEELTVCCASHNATEDHQRIVTSVLKKSGRQEDDLMCGFSPPLDETELARITLGQVEPSPIRCECSGEHAGMLAACSHRKWPIEDYVSAEHPLQQEIRSIVAAACGVADEDLDLATDGCSIPTFGAPIAAFARAYAVLADPEGTDWRGSDEVSSALLRLREAIARHPEVISGEGEIDTVIMQKTDGRVIAKLGAEGLLCMAVPAHRLGVAIEDAGGSTRGLGPAAIAVLEQLGLEAEETLAELREELCPPIKSFAGAEVGETRAALALEQSPGAGESAYASRLPLSGADDTIASIH